MSDWKVILAGAVGVGLGLYVWRNFGRTMLGSFVGTASQL
jgi:hypothetical protein